MKRQGGEMQRVLIPSMFVVLAGVVGCGDPAEPADTNVTITVTVLNGPTPTGPNAYVGNTTSGYGVSLTPNQYKFTIARLGLVDATTGEVRQSVTNCAVNFDRYAPTATTIGTCSVAVPPGTYSAVQLGYSGQATLLIADTSSGWFSRSSGNPVFKALPAAAASPAQLSLYDTISTIRLRDKLVVDRATQPNLWLVVDAYQSANPYCGSFGCFVNLRPPMMIPSVQAPTAMEYYVFDAYPGAGAFCTVYCSNYPGINAFTVVYTGANTPGAVAMHYYQQQRVCPLTSTTMLVSDARGYLGLDPGTSDLAWATATDDNWTTYSGVLRIHRAASVGDAATLRCLNTTSVAQPSGSSFASGAPAIPSGSEYVIGGFVLIAK